MSKDLNPGLRATTAVTSPLVRQGSATLNAAVAELQLTYPGFAPFTTAVTQPLNVGRIDYDALLLSVNKRFSNNYSARVSYTLSLLARQHVGQRRAGQRLPGARRHAPRAERRRRRRSTRGTTSWSAARRCVPHTGGLNVELGGAGAERLAVQPDEREHRPRSQRHPVRAAAGRRLLRHRTRCLHREELHRPSATARTVPGSSSSTRASAISSRLPNRRKLEAFVDFFNLTNRDELPEPVRKPGVAAVPAADRLQHELHAAQDADRRAVRVLRADRPRRFRRSRRFVVSGLRWLTAKASGYRPDGASLPVQGSAADLGVGRSDGNRPS